MDDYEYQRQERRKLQAECSMPSDIGVLDIPMNVTDKEIKIAQLLKKDAETILNIAFASYQPMYFTKQGFQYCIRVRHCTCIYMYTYMLLSNNNNRRDTII